MKNAESTPLFECPLHALLTDLGFSDGDGDSTSDPLNTGISKVGAHTCTHLFRYADRHVLQIRSLCL